MRLCGSDVIAKPGMGDSKPAFFVGKNGRGCFDGIALLLCAYERTRIFQPMLQKQLMNITHAAH